MVPDVVDRFTGKDERMTEKEVNDILDAEIENKKKSKRYIILNDII